MGINRDNAERRKSFRARHNCADPDFLNGKQDIGHVISGEQVQKWITKIWEWIKFAFWWFIDLFRTRYEVTVSFNKEWGDADDRSYIAKKISVQKEKHLKFTNEDNEVIEYRSAAGLNYIIREL